MNQIIYDKDSLNIRNNIIHERYNERRIESKKEKVNLVKYLDRKQYITIGSSAKYHTEAEPTANERFHRKLIGVGKSSTSRLVISTTSPNSRVGVDAVSRNQMVVDHSNDNINDDDNDNINDNDNDIRNHKSTKKAANTMDYNNGYVDKPEERLPPRTVGESRSKFTLQRPKIEFDDDATTNTIEFVQPLNHGVDSPVIVTPRNDNKKAGPFPPPHFEIMTSIKLSPRVNIHKKRVPKAHVNSDVKAADHPSKGTSSNQLADLTLSPFERDEVRSYSRVYFVSEHANKVESKIDQPNFGFDDNHGDYLVNKNDHIAYRYQFLDVLGRGSFGFVYKCADHKKGEEVAMKIIRNRQNFRHQAEIESKILLALKQFKESNPDAFCKTIALLDVFEFRCHLFLVFPVKGLNLYEYIKSNNFQGTSMRFVRSIAIQLMECLVHFRALGIIHCDLKLENILIEDEKAAKIVVIDFGSSCFASETMYSYIQSRFYRAPEVIMGMTYSYEIDMWSVGCILPELRSGKAAFPGDSEGDQLVCIAEVLCEPPKQMVESCKRKDLFHEDGSMKVLSNKSGTLRTIGSRRIDDLITVRSKDKPFVSFLEHCLRWDPCSRITPSEALLHPWLD